MDLYFTEEGDLTIAPNGDLAITQTPWRSDVQQAYIRTMTDAGDYLLYPALGASLSMLKGLPQTPGTGQLGVNLIRAALEREGRFTGKPITVNAIPTGYQTIRFDIMITSGSRQQIRLSIEQNLTGG